MNPVVNHIQSTPENTETITGRIISDACRSILISISDCGDGSLYTKSSLKRPASLKGV